MAESNKTIIHQCCNRVLTMAICLIRDAPLPATVLLQESDKKITKHLNLTKISNPAVNPSNGIPMLE